MKGERWWYHILLWCIAWVICLQIPAVVQADTNRQLSALVIEQQQETTDRAEKPTQIVTESYSMPTQRSSRTSDMLQHVFAIVFCGVMCTALGIAVLVWHIRQDRADEAYIAQMMRNYGELPAYSTEKKAQEKESYGGKTVFIRRKQA